MQQLIKQIGDKLASASDAPEGVNTPGFNPKKFQNVYVLEPQLKALLVSKGITHAAVDVDLTLVDWIHPAAQANYFLAVNHLFLRPAEVRQEVKDEWWGKLWSDMEQIHTTGEYHRLAPETYQFLVARGIQRRVQSFQEMDILLTEVRTKLIVPALIDAGLVNRAPGANRFLCALLFEGVIGRILTMTPEGPARRYIEPLLDADVSVEAYRGDGALFGDSVPNEAKKPKFGALQQWSSALGVSETKVVVVDDTLRFIESCLKGGVGAAIWKMIPKAEADPIQQALATSLSEQFGDRFIKIRSLEELTVLAS